MEGCCDFIEWLGIDMSVKILMCLDDPSDLVRASVVSRSWRNLVIVNCLSKQLCLRIFPEISSLSPVIEANDMIEPIQLRHERSMAFSCLERKHKVYAFLAKGLTCSMRKDCIRDAIVASSTDNFPDESIHNTLEPSDRVGQRASYWSSKGEFDPEVPETLIYKLIANLCVVTEIHVQPFEAYFQFGLPIYSAKAVRFRLGRLNVSGKTKCDEFKVSSPAHGLCNDTIVWTYTSPEFVMTQESRLQKFKLPEPVLCIGGILQVELLGRVQRQVMDDKYYICVTHVQVVGRPLLPAFDAEVIDPSGKCMLKYYPMDECCPPLGKLSEREASPSHSRSFTANIRGWERIILNSLLGGGAAVVVDNDDDTDDEVLD